MVRTLLESADFVQRPDWSPDGTSILVVVGDDVLITHPRSGGQVVVLDAELALLRDHPSRSSQTLLMPANVPEPPEQIRYDLDEALTLLGALEDARDALIDSGHLAVVVSIETEIRALSRKLGFDDPAGGTDGR